MVEWKEESKINPVLRRAVTQRMTLLTGKAGWDGAGRSARSSVT